MFILNSSDEDTTSSSDAPEEFGGSMQNPLSVRDRAGAVAMLHGPAHYILADGLRYDFVSSLTKPRCRDILVDSQNAFVRSLLSARKLSPDQLKWLRFEAAKVAGSPMVVSKLSPVERDFQDYRARMNKKNRQESERFGHPVGSYARRRPNTALFTDFDADTYRGRHCF